MGRRRGGGGGGEEGGRGGGGGGSRDELEFIVLRRFEAWRIVSATCQ